MPPEQQVAVPVEPPSLRESIEAAVEVQEKAEASPPPEAKPVTGHEQVITPAPVPAEQQQVEAKPVEGQTPVAPAEQTYDEAPKSWKAPARALWDKVPTEARAEVYRRDRDVVKALSDGARGKEFFNQMSEVVRPFEARFRSTGYTMPQMVGELLKADHLLSTASPVARAQYMAKLIKDYEVDIRELDSALAGEGPANPVQSEVERLVNERLSPLQKFVDQQRQQEEQRNLHIQQEALESVEQMETDPKYPHLEVVREDMADLMDIATKRGVVLDLPTAYQRACAMNPELAAQMVTQQQTTLQRQQAVANNAKAQRALGASVSVAGQPSGLPGNNGSTGSLRETIEAAFNQVSGR